MGYDAGAKFGVCSVFPGEVVATLGSRAGLGGTQTRESGDEKRCCHHLTCGDGRCQSDNARRPDGDISWPGDATSVHALPSTSLLDNSRQTVKSGSDHSGNLVSMKEAVFRAQAFANSCEPRCNTTAAFAPPATPAFLQLHPHSDRSQASIACIKLPRASQTAPDLPWLSLAPHMVPAKPGELLHSAGSACIEV